MGMLFSGIFWGVVLIIFGITIIIKIIFNIHIPLFRIMIALFFIYLGIQILMGWKFFPQGNERSAIFNETKIQADSSDNEYNIIFGKGDVDLTKIDLKEKSVNIKINTVFGGSFIKLNPEMPYIIKVDSAFAGARLPDGNNAAFGTYVYKSKNFKEHENHLRIKASVVFGGIEFNQ